jgi:hypothetical protein
MPVHKIVFALGLATAGWFSLPAEAQSLCDLLPAATVKATLNLNTSLLASPDMDWGNGCDYTALQGKQPVVSADSSDDTGMDSIALTNHVAAPNSDDQLVSGIGKAAIYTDDPHEPDPAMPNIYVTRQSLIFRTEDKIVDFVVMTSSNSPTETAILALGKLAASESIDELKDSPN